jgi:hypothetical protein
VAARNSGGRTEGDLAGLVAGLSVEEMREVVLAATDRHGDVAAAVRLVAARADGDLRQLRAEVDRTLRTRRFLHYAESSGWAQAAAPLVGELRDTVKTSPSAELVALLQRAVGHVVKVILNADDSDGRIGDLARELLDLHAEACDAGLADPVKLASWMIRFRYNDQDFFEVDPVRYAAALGERGVAAYRREVAERGGSSFAAAYARERLAILDGDVAEVVRLMGGDLSSAYQFVRVAEAMEELGRDDDVVAWAARGIEETSGWQTAQLYDLACGVHTRRAAPLEVLRLRADQHQRMHSLATYGGLRAAADAVGVWSDVRDAARATLAQHDLGGLVDALLEDGDADLAWQVMIEHAEWDPGPHRRLRLAQERERTHPAEAVAVYWRIVDDTLLTTGRRAYITAVSVLGQARKAADAAGDRAAFDERLGRLRDQQRRRPTMITMLDKANLV